MKSVDPSFQLGVVTQSRAGAAWRLPEIEAAEVMYRGQL